MSSDELVDLLGTLDEDEQNEIITNMNTEEVEEVKPFYPMTQSLPAVSWLQSSYP